MLKMQASKTRPGMELIEVNGVPVDQILEKEIYPYVFASTPQDRDVKAFERLLKAETDSTISATFLDMKGKAHTVDLMCNLSKHRDAAPWRERPPFKYRELPDGIIYTAITLRELTKLKNLIFSLDQEAFVVVNDTKEVLGRGHETRKIY